MKAKDLARIVKGRLVGDPELSFCDLATDSRKVKEGDLFIALKGAKHDGHDFINSALTAGAVGAISEKEIKPPEGKFAVIVDSSLGALHRLAHEKRKNFKGKAVAVAGSVGKTTTKDLIHFLLSAVGKACKSEGNLNSQVGLPLTLWKMDEEADFWVLEMGASKVGEIKKLVAFAKPHIRVITALGEEHLEGFGSFEGVIKGNGEIFEGFSEEDFAVIPSYALSYYSLPRDRVLTFGRNGDLKAEKITLSLEGTAFYFEGESFKVPVLSVGVVDSCLAAFGVLRVLGYDPKDFKDLLYSFSPPEGRMNLYREGNFYLIDDTYNANPPSVRNALKTLSLVGRNLTKVAVLGDMLELGEDSRRFHTEVGLFLKEAGVDIALFYGRDMVYAYREFARLGGKGRFFKEKSDLIEEVLKLKKDNHIILVKGSRGMKMEEVVKSLKETESYGTG